MNDTKPYWMILIAILAGLSVTILTAGILNAVVGIL